MKRFEHTIRAAHGIHGKPAREIVKIARQFADTAITVSRAERTVRGDALLTILFALLTQILMQLGRCAVAALLGYPAEFLIGFITTDLLSALFCTVIVWSIRRIEGLFEDQKHYLLRIQREHKVERGEQF